MQFDLNSVSAKVFINEAPTSRYLARFVACIGGMLWLNGNVIAGQKGPFASFEQEKDPKSGEWKSKIVCKKEFREWVLDAVMEAYNRESLQMGEPSRSRGEVDAAQPDPFASTAEGDELPF
jgi:hypothetical protein